jgi:hypothetical protein
MDWDYFKLVALISAIVTILDKFYTYGGAATHFLKKFLKKSHSWFVLNQNYPSFSFLPVFLENGLSGYKPRTLPKLR